MISFKNSNIKLSDRNYSLDILRIVSMLGIIGLHMLNAGGIGSASEGLNFVLARIILRLLYSSVNIFAMLTGYLYISKEKISTNSIIKLLFVVAFYCVLITVLAFFGCRELLIDNKKLIIASLVPPTAGRYWYITSYVLLFFMIPYISVLLKTISKETFEKMIVILFILLSVITTFGLKDYFEINRGYSPFWLIFCYITGAYIKLYGNLFKLSKLKKCIAIAVNIMLILLIEILIKKSVGISASFHEYSSPFIYINSILILEVFTEIKFEKVPRKFVLSLSNASFGVYIIHSHILIYDNLITGRFKWFGNLNPMLWLICFVLVNASIYLLCYACEFFRGYIFKIAHVDKISKKLSDKVDSALGW